MEMTSIGHRIKRARERLGLTQEEFSSRVGLSTTYISTIERGLKLPKMDTFIRIANALDVPADYLLADVVIRSSESSSDEIDKILSSMPEKERNKMYAIIKILTED